MGSIGRSAARGCSAGKVESPVESNAETTGEQSNDSTETENSGHELHNEVTELQTSGIVRWNVYESAEGYDREAGKTAWGEWELVGSHKTEYEAERQIKMRKDHLHYKNSTNDYGIVQLQWEKRHELMLPAHLKVTQMTSVTEREETPELLNQVTELQKQLQLSQTENQALLTENSELKSQLQTPQLSNHVQPDYEAIRDRTLNKLKLGKQSAAGKAVEAFIREVKREHEHRTISRNLAGNPQPTSTGT